VEHARRLLDEAREWRVELDGTTLGFIMQTRLEQVMLRLKKLFFGSSERLSQPARSLNGIHREQEDPLGELAAAVELVGVFPFEVNLWRVQNIYYELLKEHLPEVHNLALNGDESAWEWKVRFLHLGQLLKVRVEDDTTTAGG
jgi:hypothetical protein